MKKAISVFMILCILFSWYGCTSTRITYKNEIKPGDNIESIHLINGMVVSFSGEGGVYDEERELIHGYNSTGEYLMIPMKDIDYVSNEVFDKTKTGTNVITYAIIIALVAGGVTLGFGI